MLYHDGPVRTGVQNVYFIFYGCWNNPICGPLDDPAVVNIVSEFTAMVGTSPYMAINSTYTDSAGNPASPLVYAGMVFDSSYAHGDVLTKADIEAIISDQILSFRLPSDPQGIYIVATSADIASNDTGFCIPGAPPFHSYCYIAGMPTPYVFLGHPSRCPTVAGAAFVGQPTPNGSFAGDAMVANLAHALNGLLTDPFDTGWFDRYGLENADKGT